MIRVIGFIKSVVSNTYGEKTNHQIHIESEETDKYGRPNIMEVTFSRDQVTAGLNMKYEQLISQKVSLPVFINAWAGRRGANYTMYLSDSGDPKNHVLKA